MNNVRAFACKSLLIIAWGLSRSDLYARVQQQEAGSRMPGVIAAKDAKALEDLVAANPDNLPAREQLISYYFIASLTTKTAEIQEKREQHVFWLIEHHPESELAGSPQAGIMPTDVAGSTEGYQHGKQLWLAQVEKNSSNQRILRNAAQYLALFDGKVSRELLQKAVELDPSDGETSSRLAQSYEHQRMSANSPEEKTALAQKALSAGERGVEGADTENRFYQLESVATFALEAGETAKAQQYATELLQDAEKFHGNWNYGNALHKGNIVLGRIALQQGNIAKAKEHLLTAGNTPGSPQLDSFGPNMELAKELLEKGERDVVVCYLQSCAKFWKMGGDQLQSWITTVKKGGIPDFGGNLFY